MDRSISVTGVDTTRSFRLRVRNRRSQPMGSRQNGKRERILPCLRSLSASRFSKFLGIRLAISLVCWFSGNLIFSENESYQDRFFSRPVGLTLYFPPFQKNTTSCYFRSGPPPPPPEPPPSGGSDSFSHIRMLFSFHCWTNINTKVNTLRNGLYDSCTSNERI